MNLLDSIDSPEALRELSIGQLYSLCGEIREFLIENVAKTGGHLAANLGAVELTVALHRVYDTSRDRLVFDVGHQCYVHKLLTGRREAFHTLRKLDGVSGFPKPLESVHDASIAGHASNAVSVALGLARSRTLQGADIDIVALVGDGALTGGLAFEGLADAGASGEPMVVVLNDNGMSIDKSVGGVSNMLARLRVRPAYFRFKRWYRRSIGKIPPLYRLTHAIKEWFKRHLLPDNQFAELGFEYLGTVDGHDIAALEAVLLWARELNRPVVVHALTQKGRGYSFAEQQPEAFHAVGAFDAETGLQPEEKRSFSDEFGAALVELAERDPKITAITAAMCAGTGLTDFAERFPERFFDAGITEGHCVAMAAGMATRGLLPVFAVYSTFLQRGYDMLIHDVALSKRHVVFAVDRAGLVGADGETHQGSFDVSYLRSVPYMAVFAPSSFLELREQLVAALYRIDGPVAVRYPRSGEGAYTGSMGLAPAVRLREGSDLTLLTYGILINEAIAAAQELERSGVSAEIIKLNLINPLDFDSILASVAKTGVLLAFEDACETSGIGEAVLAECVRRGISLRAVSTLNLGNGVVRQGTVEQLKALYGLDAYSLTAQALKLLERAGER
ncbi:MAG: 1-deoxy-D-xylulose-5-phosphate synthase [Oscillospiraceae bacterium]|nr:1-deoxy-D-xylulose-5-phosphate synthase [Oscillospiraceae bacterium]